MSDAAESFEAFEAIAAEDALVVTVDGFEGPLDLLPHPGAQGNQKVDIAKISIIQVGGSVSPVHRGGQEASILELAARLSGWMAAWLAYLKSRLILPQEKGPDGEPSADEMGD